MRKLLLTLILSILVVGLALAYWLKLATPIITQTAPAGRVAEMHSCELYTGGCTASSELTQEGRYSLRVWQFDRGEFAGQPVAGLSVGLLEISDSGNLAEKTVQPDHATLYLPTRATVEQRTALASWAQSNTSIDLAKVKQTVLPLTSQIAWEHTEISGGPNLFISATVPLACDTGTSCGESLWYTPRSPWIYAGWIKIGPPFLSVTLVNPLL
jgi:hypothetical protein